MLARNRNKFCIVFQEIFGIVWVYNLGSRGGGIPVGRLLLPKRGLGGPDGGGDATNRGLPIFLMG